MLIDRYFFITDRYFWILLLGFYLIKFNLDKKNTLVCFHNKMPVYQISRVVNGTFHQGDSRFESTAGRQCACNSLFAIFWSHIRPIARWNRHDLDRILTEGDQIYKSLNTNDYLSVDDLPTTIELNGYTSNIIFRKLLDCKTTLVREFPFSKSYKLFCK